MKFNQVNIKNIYEEDKKIKANFFLSDGYSFKNILRQRSSNTLSDLTESISNIGVNNRYYVKNRNYGVPFVSNTNLSNASPMENIKYVSRKRCFNASRLIEKEMLLFSAIGTIGEVNFATDEMEGAMTPIGNIIRVKFKNKSGFYYAFFKSKYGRSVINQLGSGSVQTYLDPTTFSKVQIPIFDNFFVEKIHNLIVDAAALRVEANKLLREAVEVFDVFNEEYISGGFVTKKISINKVSVQNKRFDANYNVVSSIVEDKLRGVKYFKISELADSIFMGPRSKRNYVANGVPFLSTSEMQKLNPTKTEKYISEKNAGGFYVKKGWLLTTRSGTLGDTIFTFPVIDNYAVSEDAIRIVIKDDSALSNKYVFAFLKSNIGRNSLVSGSYGSVILHLNEDFIGDIKVPVLQDKIEFVERNVSVYVSNMNEAIIKENQAIDLIEKEIDQWQQ